MDKEALKAAEQILIFAGIVFILGAEWFKEQAKQYESLLARVLVNSFAKVIEVFFIGFTVALLLKAYSLKHLIL